MNWIEKMIAEQCPQGVKRMKLKDADCKFIVPMRDRPKVFDGTIPWCRIEDIEGQYFNKSLSGLAVSKEVIEQMNLKVFPKGTVICSCSASLGVYAINTQPLITNQTFIGIVCSKKIYNKYLYYLMFLQTKKLVSLSNTGSIPYISREKFENLEIPLPPLDVQEKIVEVLDKFTELIKQTDEEITLRQKQYEYYREKLLTFEEGEVEWKKLENIVADDCTISYGIVQPGEGVTEGVPVVRPIDMVGPITYNKNLKKTTYAISNSYKKTLLRGGELLICVRGTTGIISMASNDLKGCNVTRGIVPLWFKEKYDKKFIYYISLSNKIQDAIENATNGAGLRQINIKDLKNIKLPIPSPSRQQEIVATLDKFEALIASLKEERELRQKQYEYYREKLLTF